MSSVVEINQVQEAKLLLCLDEIASNMGDHRQSSDYYQKLVQLSSEVIDKLGDIVMEQL